MRGKRCQCCKEKYDDPDEVLADPNDSSQSCQKSLRVNLQAGDSPLDHGVEVDINPRAEVGGSDQSSPVYLVPTIVIYYNGGGGGMQPITATSR